MRPELALVLPILIAAVAIGYVVGGNSEPGDKRSRNIFHTILMLLPAIAAGVFTANYSRDIMIYKVLEVIFSVMLAFIVSIGVSELRFHQRHPDHEHNYG